MNKKIDISDSSIRMSSFGWGSDRVKMTKKECKKFYPKQLDDTFCTFERADECICEVGVCISLQIFFLS
ncbi:hypothetical protein NECAME_17690 [Necator americanus]|uniref:Uncharacterized protein n=1 Tax=Necator americanus TaxID=51031 RepID=W2TNC7_NECAM|nr:hypothetical protein NECAME_17690 [Necator americanus]ETN82507.1 hypothetical protein NECAME_17690 [Necator americanus]